MAAQQDAPIVVVVVVVWRRRQGRPATEGRGRGAQETDFGYVMALKIREINGQFFLPAHEYLPMYTLLHKQ